MEESSDSDEEAVTVNKKKKSKKHPAASNAKRAEEFSDDFQFMDNDDQFDTWVLDLAQYAKKKSYSTSIDEKIAKLRKQRKKESNQGDVDKVENGSAEVEGSEDEKDEE